MFISDLWELHEATEAQEATEATVAPDIPMFISRGALSLVVVSIQETLGMATDITFMEARGMLDHIIITSITDRVSSSVS